MKVQISEISNKEELSGLIISELKEIGVKYRKDKKSKVVQERTCWKRIFRTHLHLLELADVILANGGVVEIPKFVADACNRILEQVETEGIFRKAGSTIRQKEIRISLEAGIPLGKSHHVIDVANVIKTFFRELPEPLIPPSIQETLLRGLLIGENSVKAILLTCLLLPPLTINTLSFFMQFLHTVTLNSHLNKMPAENLAIIFTPSLMPFSDINSLRFNNHVRVVQLLIENAHAIGTIPDCIINKLQIHEVVSNTPSKSRSFEALEIVTQKKKKKRRSGSLTQMFNGLRKIVGSIKGSSENLESTPENRATTSDAVPASAPPKEQAPVVATPCLLKTKMKRKFAEPVCAFSAKKKKDLLALLPNNSGGFLPNTPLTKESKKSRLSLGGRRHTKNTLSIPTIPSVERRWSIVGTGWSKNKTKNSTGLRTDGGITEDEKPICGPLATGYISPVLSMPAMISKLSVPKVEYPVVENISTTEESSISGTDSSSDYVRILKNEYEAIKERVVAIETRISQEFNTLADHSNTSLDELDHQLSGPERVVSRYVQVVENTEALTSPTTEHLARRLSRELKIRRSNEHRVMRSPSARKIGTIRRRSQEKARLSRNQTWHLSSTANSAVASSKEAVPLCLSQNYFYGKSNLKRGRPNTLNTGLLPQSRPHNERIIAALDSTFESRGQVNESWTDGKAFFSNELPESDKYDSSLDQPNLICNSCPEESKPLPKLDDVSCSPVKSKDSTSDWDSVKTPMLPPKSIPRKSCARKNHNSAAKSALASRLIFSTPTDEEMNGRASIARLRAQNAGMVMAKAKLFDGLGGSCNSDIENQREKPPQLIPRRPKVCFARGDGVLSEQVVSQDTDQVAVQTKEMSPEIIFPDFSQKKFEACKSPGYVQKRRNDRLAFGARLPDKHILNTITTDEQIIQPRKISQTANMRNLANVNNIRKIASPSTPRNRKHIGVNSPRRLRTHGVTTRASRIRGSSRTMNTNSPKPLGKPKLNGKIAVARF